MVRAENAERRKSDEEGSKQKVNGRRRRGWLISGSSSPLSRWNPITLVCDKQIGRARMQITALAQHL